MPSVEVRGQGAHGTTRVREQHHPSTLVQHWRERGRRSPKCSPDEESNQPSGSMQSSEAISAECGVLTSPPSTKRHARGIVDVAVRLKVRRVPPVMRSQSAQRHRRRPALHCRLTPRRRPLHCRLTSRRLHTHPRRRRARALGHRPEEQTRMVRLAATGRAARLHDGLPTAPTPTRAGMVGNSEEPVSMASLCQYFT